MPVSPSNPAGLPSPAHADVRRVPRRIPYHCRRNEHAGLRALETGRQIRQPVRRDGEHQRFELVVETGDDQQPHCDQQATEDPAAVSADAHQRVAPAWHESARSERNHDQHRRDANPERQNGQSSRADIVPFARERDRRPERRADTRAPAPMIRTTSASIPLDTPASATASATDVKDMTSPAASANGPQRLSCAALPSVVRHK